MDQSGNEKSGSNVFHAEDTMTPSEGEHEAAHRGALLDEAEREMSYFSNLKSHWRVVLYCEQSSFTSPMGMS